MVMLKCVCLFWGHIPRIHFWRPPWGRSTNSLGLIFIYSLSFIFLSVQNCEVSREISITRASFLSVSRELLLSVHLLASISAEDRGFVHNLARVSINSPEFQHSLARDWVFARSICILSRDPLSEKLFWIEFTVILLILTDILCFVLIVSICSSHSLTVCLQDEPEDTLKHSYQTMLTVCLQDAVKGRL